MQITATTPVREHEKPMSWARAVLLATGFFFATAILVGQLPGYIFTISTLSTLARFEQGMLDLGLIALGLGVLCFEVALLYDPKPILSLFVPVFALAGVVVAVIGGYLIYQVYVGVYATNIFGQPGWSEFLPDTIQRNGHAVTWPAANQPYLFHPAWFQLQSIDLSAVGLIALVVGLGMLGFAVLNPIVLSGRFVGPLRDLLVRFSIGLSIVIVALYLSIYTFTPTTFEVKNAKNTLEPGPVGNVLLFVALLLAIFALQLWLLPVMVANRSRFMPATYLHGVVGLIGNVAAPLLLAWVVIYPLVNLVHSADSQQFWVQCSQKTNIPGSCTLTPFTGYIICALAFGMPFTLLLAGLYFWSTRRDMVVLGGTIGILFLSLALLLVHVDDPVQLPLMLVVATGIAILAFIWTWGTQREFAPTAAQQLGCTGQWLVLGTLTLLFLFGFAAFSLPGYFESESLALFYVPGHNLLHDAFWAILLMGGLAAFQLALLIRRRPMTNLRKFAMWAMLVALGLEMVGAIQGFHRNVLTLGVNAMEGSHAVFVAGICFEAVGIAACLYGALRAVSRSIPWAVAIGVVVLLCLAFGVVIYNLTTPYPELVVFAFIAAMAGAFAYTALGPDPADTELSYMANGNGESSFVVSR